MLGSKPPKQADQVKRKRFWTTWMPTLVVILSIIVLIVVGFFIVMVQGAGPGFATLTIISIIFGMVVSILSLLVNFFQWREAAATNVIIDNDATSAPDPGPEPWQNLPTPTPQRLLTQPVEDEQMQSLQIEGRIVTGHLATSPLPPAALFPLLQQDGNPPYIDWGEAPAVEHFFGREQELALLKRWVEDTHCRLVVIQGIGGMGKTFLSVVLTQQVSTSFDFVFWHTLKNAPPIEQLLETCVAFLSNQQVSVLPQNLDAQIAKLIEHLHKRRCLLVLDNFESVLQSGDRVGVYRSGYEGYGRLLDLVSATSQHQSCLLVTTREKPLGQTLLGGSSQAVRMLELKGLKLDEARMMLQGTDLSGSDEDWARFIHLYASNPLSLRLISDTVSDMFQGDIAAFLNQGVPLASEISHLVEQQFERASPLEQEILYWLAIEREKVSLEELKNDIVHGVYKEDPQDALASLRRRFLVERVGTALFVLQPVILEYITGRLVKLMCQELSSGDSIEFLQNYALIKAQAKDYVRVSQARFLLKPTATYLYTNLGQEETECRLKSILTNLQDMAARRPGYAAGNIVNILIVLNVDLSGYDFSRLVIRQAYLQDARLVDVNFASTDLTTCTFKETFGNILSVALDVSGHVLAASTANGKIALWRMPEGIPFMKLGVPGHDEWMRTIAFSPQGDILASGGDDGTVRLWKVNSSSGRERVLRGHRGRVYAVAFSPSGDLLASGGEDDEIHIWDARSQECVKILPGLQHHIRSLAFGPQGDTLASGSEDYSIALWDIQTGLCTHTLREHSNQVYSVAFSKDGKLLASGSHDWTVRIWDAHSGQCIHVLKEHSKRVQSVAFSPDNRLVASGSEDQTVRLWDSESGRCVRVLQDHRNRVRTVTFSADGSRVVGGDDDQVIHVWDVETGQIFKTLHGYSNWIYAVAFSPDGRTVVSDNNDFALHEWDVASWQTGRAFQGHTNWIYTLAFSPNGKLLASGSDDQDIRLWNVKDDSDIRIDAGDRVRSVAFSPDGKVFASGSDAQDILLWDSATGQRVGRLQGHSDRVRRVVFAGDTGPIGTKNGVINMAKGANEVKGESNTNSMILASGGEDETVRIWKIDEATMEGSCIHIFGGHSGRVWSIDFSPVDSNVLASGDEYVIRLWDVAAERCIATLSEHNRRIYALAFSPDGTLLASGCEDHTVRLWNVKTQQCLAVLAQHDMRIRAVAFNPTGTLLASASHDGTVRIWDVQSHTCITALRIDRPYERLNITGAKGITGAQKSMLKDLGAVEL